MNLDYNHLPAWLQWVIIATILLTLFAGVVMFFRKVWPALVAWVNIGNALIGLPQSIEDQKEAREEERHFREDIRQKVAEIHHEVQFNNGSSVKDAVTRVEAAQAKTDEQLGAVVTSQKRIMATQARVEKGVKGLYDRIDTTDQKAAELREDLEQTRPHPPARKR